MNLNEIAILLIELDSQTLSGLNELHKAVQEAKSVLPDREKSLLIKAEKMVNSLPGIQNNKRKAVIDDIGKLLEEAMKKQQKATNGKKTIKRDKSEQSPSVKFKDTFIMPQNIDADLLADFITENMEYLGMAESALLSWEKNPDDQELVNTIFRAFHTIKGTSAFIDLDCIKDLAHKAESMLALIRDGHEKYQPLYSDLGLKTIDVLKKILEQLNGSLKSGKITIPDGYQSLMDKLDSQENDSAGQKGAKEPAAEINKPSFQEWLSKKAVDEKINQSLNNGKQSDENSESTLRVRIERLDKLIDMVGELVIAQSMVAQDEAIINGTNYDLAKKVSHTGKIVRELQDLSMYLRMVTLKTTFQKMARLARDLSQKSGKMVNFLSEGGETEIDRNMVDLITDPLIHMIRNSVDHGLETPEERRKAGKSGDGYISLTARHAEGSVLLEVKDDGKGLDKELILKKAKERGLLDASDRISDQDIYQLIFQPGFSTAEKVTDISGRGVGLDVVRKAVEELHGRIEIESAEGQGCTFTLRMPLTMTITDGMVVRVGGEKYILPTANIQIALRPTVADIHTVEGKAEMLDLRGQMVPVFRLHRLFGVAGAKINLTEGLLVIVGEGVQRCALFVDDLMAQNQVVTKSLGNNMGKVPGIAGGAIMGDGRVGLILDIPAMIKFAQEGSSLE